MVFDGVAFMISLNHLQGEYWIATVFYSIHTTPPLGSGLNHLQGEYWIAT